MFLLPLQSTPSLPDQLRLLGLYAANTLGDGNCLFRALADQVYGSPVRHAEVRRDVCDWIEKHGERYEGFVEFEGGDDDDEGSTDKRRGGGKGEGGSSGNSKRLQAYLRNMRENGTYGGHMELSAFAHMMRRNIKVVQPGLVYVIEWRAGEPAASSEASSSSQQASSSKPVSTSSTSASATTAGSGKRRSSRSVSAKSDNGDAVVDKDAGKTKHKVGKGYYVYEEVTSDEEEEKEKGEEDEGREEEAIWNADTAVEEKEERKERGDEEDGGPTIYVAYHDWEHFSSIRNLRGPHTGLPNIQETPAPPSAFAEYGASVSNSSVSSRANDKEALKEKERERKRERERKEKEREKERRERGAGALKVKLRIPPSSSVSAASSKPVSKAAADVPAEKTETAAGAVPATLKPVSIAGTMNSAGVAAPAEPTAVPLPTSRSSSPFSLPTHLQAELGHGSTSAARAASPLRYMESASSQSGYRSPKRSFDESSASASGGEDRDRDRDEGGSGREEKRARRRMPSGSEAFAGYTVSETMDVDVRDENVEDIDVDVDGEVELDTPALSAPGSSSSSTFSSSLSEVSLSPSPEPPSTTVELVEEAAPPSPVTHPTPSKPLKKGTQRYQQQRHLEQSQASGGKEEKLTRRQRKALGLPKARKVFTAGTLGAPSAGGISAGKIVIPGGRWTGRELPKNAAEQAAADAAAEEEWRRNGTGRLDVRGFRELKI
ncbi:hypothetical protein D9613_004015 [Agrocybe pediades]|uniref:OTU domain-containing protein n=1 Tax=Agrocybe pediades TaxID=84607 RepID=A0A8H4QIT8_9AGAR|nr:hypothetical protein D9613_004015 [Agrocybe pediades]